MKLKINPAGTNAIQVEIEGEDYSLADVIHRELLQIRKVKFAGVAPPHPLIKTLTLQVHTDGTDPRKALKEAVKLCEDKVGEMLTVANQTFPNALKPSSTQKAQVPKEEQPLASTAEARES